MAFPSSNKTFFIQQLLNTDLFYDIFSKDPISQEFPPKIFHNEHFISALFTNELLSQKNQSEDKTPSNRDFFNLDILHIILSDPEIPEELLLKIINTDQLITAIFSNEKFNELIKKNEYNSENILKIQDHLKLKYN